MMNGLKAIALLTLLCVPGGRALAAQTTATPEGLLARTAVERIPIGATLTLRLRDGERFRAVLLSADEAQIRVKPATRLPERSRLIAFDQIERIERYQDCVNVGKYAGVGGAIGAAVMLALLAGI